MPDQVAEGGIHLVEEQLIRLQGEGPAVHAESPCQVRDAPGASVTRFLQDPPGEFGLVAGRRGGTALLHVEPGGQPEPGDMLPLRHFRPQPALQVAFRLLDDLGETLLFHFAAKIRNFGQRSLGALPKK